MIGIILQLLKQGGWNPAYDQYGRPVQQQQQMQQPMQQPQQQMPQQPMQGQMPQQPVQQSANASMKDVIIWSAIGGSASGAVQGLLTLISGFNIIDMLTSIGIAAVLGILCAIIIGSAGKSIPVKARLMVKLAALMFIANMITGFIFGMGEGALMIAGMIGIGAGSFLYGYIVEMKVPDLD